MPSPTQRIKFSNSNIPRRLNLYKCWSKKITRIIFFLASCGWSVSISISDSVFKNNDLIRNVFSGWLIEDTNVVVSCVAVFVRILNFVCGWQMLFSRISLQKKSIFIAAHWKKIIFMNDLVGGVSLPIWILLKIYASVRGTRTWLLKTFHSD